ncbi:LacI family DNA-binding transcriptional regulator [Fibrella forsythiae]|uniref:LacI family DNA-binding transcriptional regulator n=1 Tax=Fibrella forsythiae TaxID=2817061 RepID=A0ABS3JN54_9BACT|nr:LacI family DNA-binding transcriptional regulator [Fibrella forsythiae]MBO0951443.1 LacI family DNA-binding transcriptional regulator [Fibrella forsythiae]
MRRSVTLKDLAKELGLSVSGVSKALRNDPGIGDATVARVRQLAEERNYVPNLAAIHLKQKRNFKIGVIIPDLFDQFYGLALRGIEDTAARNQYSVVFTQTHEQPDRERALIETMIRNRIDGLLISITTQTDQTDFVDQLEAIGIPVVFFVRAPRDRPSYNVTADSFEGSREAITYLIRKGHRRIAHLRGPTLLSLSQVRYDGYLQALYDHQLPFDANLVKQPTPEPDSVDNLMRELMQLNDPPTAVFTFKNYLTLDAISYMQRNDSARVSPLDFIGFGNLPLLKHIDYRPLAAVDADPFDLGAEAFDLLHQRMVSSSEPVIQQVKIPCQMTIY